MYFKEPVHERQLFDSGPKQEWQSEWQLVQAVPLKN